MVAAHIRVVWKSTQMANGVQLQIVEFSADKRRVWFAGNLVILDTHMLQLPLFLGKDLAILLIVLFYVEAVTNTSVNVGPKVLIKSVLFMKKMLGWFAMVGIIFNFELKHVNAFTR